MAKSRKAPAMSSGNRQASLLSNSSYKAENRQQRKRKPGPASVHNTAEEPSASGSKALRTSGF